MTWTECHNYRYGDLDDQNHVRHPIIGKMQDSYLDQRQHKPNPQRELEDLQPSGYFKGQADLHTGNV